MDEESDEGGSTVIVAGMGENLLRCTLLEQDEKDKGGTRP